MKEIIIAYDENTESSPVLGDWVSELVRCKDCIHGRLYELNCVNCEYMELSRDADWFCVDGAKKDD